MITRRSTFSLIIFLLISVQLLTLSELTLAITNTSARPPAFNISRYIYPKVYDELRPQPSLLLKDVLEMIGKTEEWNLDDVRVSKIDVEEARYGSLQRYDIRITFGGDTEFVFRPRDKVLPWKEFGHGGGGDFDHLVGKLSSEAELDTFRVQGPCELLVGGDEELSLTLPLNILHTGLKRIIVGDGITLAVTSAQEVSLSHKVDVGLQVNESFRSNWERSEFWSFLHSLCVPPLPVNILGSASVFAYRTGNPDASIESAFLSNHTIELLADKCYISDTCDKQKSPVDSLSLKIALLEKLLRRALGDSVSLYAASGFLTAKIRASTVVYFQLGLERDVRNNTTLWTTLAEWRTRPAVEQLWFEVVAKIEGKRLKPLKIKEMRPFMVVDSSSWSSLMSNISFTKFPSILDPSEALTLDVKW